MEKLPGIKKAIANYKKAILFVEFDHEKTTKSKILKAILKMGYRTRVDKKAKWPKAKK